MPPGLNEAIARNRYRCLSCYRIAIEAAIEDYWYKYVGLDGRVIGMSTFGESAPAGELFREFGFTVDNIVDTALELLDN